MKKLVAKLILVGTLALVAAGAKSRNRLRSTFKIKQHYGVWMMRVEFSLEGLNEAMETHYQETNLLNLPEEVYREKLLNYVKNSIAIKANNVLIELSSADLNIEKDRVDLMWSINNMPNNISDMKISLKTCKELPKQSTVLHFYYQQTMHRYVLSEDNNFEVNFVV